MRFFFLLILWHFDAIFLPSFIQCNGIADNYLPFYRFRSNQRLVKIIEIDLQFEVIVVRSETHRMQNRIGCIHTHANACTIAQPGCTFIL